MMRMPVATKKGGMAQGGPDVCHVPSPSPPGGVPTPFPNMASLSGTESTVSKVQIEKKDVVVEKSEVPSSKGDEAGSSSAPTPKGLVSQKNRGECKFKKASSKVRAEGNPVVIHLVPTVHNGSNANAPAGVHGEPSQSKVFAAP